MFSQKNLKKFIFTVETGYIDSPSVASGLQYFSTQES